MVYKGHKRMDNVDQYVADWPRYATIPFQLTVCRKPTNSLELVSSSKRVHIICLLM